MIFASVILLGISTAKASDFSYTCHQVRTTAEEAGATTRLKSVKLSFTRGSAELSTRDYDILDMDGKLPSGGIPMTHVAYGGYFVSTMNEVFRCERPI